MPIQPIKVSPLSGFYKFPTPASEFEIPFTEGSSQLKEEIYLHNKVELLFCLSGSGEISYDINSQDIGRQKITAGSALLLPARLTRYRLEFSGGRLYRVVVP